MFECYQLQHSSCLSATDVAHVTSLPLLSAMYQVAHVRVLLI